MKGWDCFFRPRHVVHIPHCRAYAVVPKRIQSIVDSFSSINTQSARASNIIATHMPHVLPICAHDMQMPCSACHNGVPLQPQFQAFGWEIGSAIFAHALECGSSGRRASAEIFRNKWISQSEAPRPILKLTTFHIFALSLEGLQYHNTRFQFACDAARAGDT